MKPRIILGIIAVIALAAGLRLVLQSPANPLESEMTMGNGTLANQPAPDFSGGTGWINSPPLQIADLRGKVVLVDFFDYTCVNCRRTIPYLLEWNKRYKDRGLVIVGVHSPEFAFAARQENLARAMQRLDIPWPVVNDSGYRVWDAWSNHWWPRKLLVDAKGIIRYDHIGEGGYPETETAIRKLLSEAGLSREYTEPTVPYLRVTDTPGLACYPQSMELYAGIERGTLGKGDYIENEVHDYGTLPKAINEAEVYLEGPWIAHREMVRSAGDRAHPSRIAIRYQGSEVNVVLRQEQERPVRVDVSLSDQPIPVGLRGEDIRVDAEGRTYVEAGEGGMIRLIGGTDWGERILVLTAREPGVEVYAYTFGSCPK